MCIVFNFSMGGLRTPAVLCPSYTLSDLQLLSTATTHKNAANTLFFHGGLLNLCSEFKNLNSKLKMFDNQEQNFAIKQILYSDHLCGQSANN